MDEVLDSKLAIMTKISDIRIATFELGKEIKQGHFEDEDAMLAQVASMRISATKLFDLTMNTEVRNDGGERGCDGSADFE